VMLKQTNCLDKFERFGGSDKLSELQELKKAGRLNELSGTQLFLKFVKYVATDTTKSLVKEKVAKDILRVKFEDIVENSKKGFQESVSNSIKSNERLMQKLRTNSTDTIIKTANGFSKVSEVKSMAKEVALWFLKLFQSKVIDALIAVADITKSTIDFMRCQDQFISYLESELQDGNCESDVDEIVKKITSKLANEMIQLWCNMNDTFTELHAIIIEGHKSETVDDVVDTSSSIKIPVSKAYSILGLESTASLSQIKRSYRRLALEVHPDKNPNDPNAEQKFQRVNDAYQELLKKNSMN
jgi:DnaJ-domain-containing protein 1